MHTADCRVEHYICSWTWCNCFLLTEWDFSARHHYMFNSLLVFLVNASWSPHTQNCTYMTNAGKECIPMIANAFREHLQQIQISRCFLFWQVLKNVSRNTKKKNIWCLESDNINLTVSCLGRWIVYTVVIGHHGWSSSWSSHPFLKRERCFCLMVTGGMSD